MSSLHIAAEKGEIAERILLPGDPLRAKFIAENFLEGRRNIPPFATSSAIRAPITVFLSRYRGRAWGCLPSPSMSMS